MRAIPTTILAFTLFLSGFTGVAQERKTSGEKTLSGYVRDNRGEALIGVNIYFPLLERGCTSNEYGFYSISLPAGTVLLRASFVGFETFTDTLELSGNLLHDIELLPSTQKIGDVQVRATVSPVLDKGRLQSVTLPMSMITEAPALFGETDLIKTLQLLPGVLAANEGVSNFNVRGGNYDQNLILLDEATVFNPSHLMGFFSVFNPDVIKDVRLYKGNLPASDGGRLSSVLDVRMRDGNRDHFAMRGGVGTVASRLAIEAPILNHQGSILLAGRRSYADIFLPLSSNEEINKNKIYFFDLNLKANLSLGDKDRIYLSGYGGRDDFVYRNDYYLSWGNYTSTFRWNHLFSGKLFSNYSLIYSRYNYRLGQTTELTGVEWKSFMDNIQSRYDFTWYLNPASEIRFGSSSAYFHFSPGNITAQDTLSVFNNFSIPGSNALDNALYAEYEWDPNEKITVEAGVRGGLFLNIGPATVYHYDAGYSVIDSSVYGKREVYHILPSAEPHVGITYRPDTTIELYASYGYTRQFIHLISNTTTGTPLDIWIPSDPNINPQYAHHVSAGVQLDLKNNYTLSTELYYKRLGNQIDYKEHANIILNPELTGELRIGKAKAWGLEWMLRKNSGRLKGWISYTWSRALRTVPEINQGKSYPAPYDRPHNLSVAGIWNISPRLVLSMLWTYQTGAPITFPQGRFVFDNIVVPVFSERNAYRLPDYHRMDISLTLKPNPLHNKKFRSEWNFSVYNVYNRKNAWMIYFQANKENPQVTEAWKLYMFPVIPSITWNFYY